MGNKWPERPLDDVCLGIYDCPHSTPKLSDSGPYMVRTQDIRQGYFDMSSAVRVSEEVYVDRTRRVVPRHGDLLFSREGTYFGDAAEVPPDTSVCLGQRMVLIRPNPEIIRPRYLRMLINSPSFQSIVLQYRDGTVAERLNLPVIRKLPIVVPSFDEQDHVIRNLACVEEKMSVNRRMNETLEAMAQALFKSWFVDFDPVIDNALAGGKEIPKALSKKAQARAALGDKRRPLPEEIRALFPDEFTFSDELGWIPTGWEVLQMPDATDFREGPGILAKDFHQEGVPLIRLAGMKNGTSLLEGCNYLDPAKVAKKWSHFRLEKGDILLSTSASLGRVAEVDDESIGAIPYTGIIGFRPKSNKTVRRYLRLYFTSSYFQEQITMMGAGSVLNHFGPTHLKKMNMLVPLVKVQESFSAKVSPIHQKSFHLLKQSQSLATLRDTLLPKLLSGELRIPEAEKMVSGIS